MRKTSFQLVLERHSNMKILSKKENVFTVRDHLKQLEQAQTEAKTVLHRSRELMTFHVNQRRGKLLEWKDEDEVLLDTRNLIIIDLKRKLAVKYAEPYKILKRVEQVAYKLKLSEQLSVYSVFHASLLKPYQRVTYSGRKEITQSPPVEVEGNQEYEVKGIESSRINKKQIQYLIRWKGYVELF